MIIDGYEVLTKLDDKTSQHFSFIKHIKLIRDGNIVNVSLQDYLGNPLPYEPVSIRITGESAQGETLEPFEGECEDGIIPLDVYVAGDKLKIESLNANVENVTLEVEI